MFPRCAAALMAVALSACSPGGPTTSLQVTSAPSSQVTSPVVPSWSPSPEPGLPAGVPPYFEEDVPSADVPSAALVPLRSEVTGTWYAATSEAEAIVVAWQVPGPDPFRLERGIAVWRRFADGGAPWRPVWGQSYGARQAVLGISALTGDVTGDGSDDVLFFAETGGSGGCGTYRVVDVRTGTLIFQEDVCDTRIDPSTSPPGLVIREAVYEQGDPHCCPSAMRETVLALSPEGEWEEVSETVTPVGF